MMFINKIEGKFCVYTRWHYNTIVCICLIMMEGITQSLNCHLKRLLHKCSSKWSENGRQTMLACRIFLFFNLSFHHFHLQKTKIVRANRFSSANKSERKHSSRMKLNKLWKKHLELKMYCEQIFYVLKKKFPPHEPVKQCDVFSHL